MTSDFHGEGKARAHECYADLYGMYARRKEVWEREKV
jgi:hypothetical protein